MRADLYASPSCRASVVENGGTISLIFIESDGNTMTLIVPPSMRAWATMTASAFNAQMSGETVAEGVERVTAANKAVYVDKPRTLDWAHPEIQVNWDSFDEAMAAADSDKRADTIAEGAERTTAEQADAMATEARWLEYKHNVLNPAARAMLDGETPAALVIPPWLIAKWTEEDGK